MSLDIKNMNYDDIFCLLSTIYIRQFYIRQLQINESMLQSRTEELLCNDFFVKNKDMIYHDDYIDHNIHVQEKCQQIQNYHDDKLISVQKECQQIKQLLLQVIHERQLIYINIYYKNIHINKIIKEYEQYEQIKYVNNIFNFTPILRIIDNDSQKIIFYRAICLILYLTELRNNRDSINIILEYIGSYRICGICCEIIDVMNDEYCIIFRHFVPNICKKYKCKILTEQLNEIENEICHQRNYIYTGYYKY